MALVIPPFLENKTIQIKEETIQLRNMLDFYVPKYEKHGKFDARGFDEQALDLEVSPLTIKKTMLEPGQWDLAIDSNDRPSINQLRPVPIATDLKSGKTLILDSNHTLASILGELDKKALESTNLSVVHITGIGLEGFVPDFMILNRG